VASKVLRELLDRIFNELFLNKNVYKKTLKTYKNVTGIKNVKKVLCIYAKYRSLKNHEF